MSSINIFKDRYLSVDGLRLPFAPAVKSSQPPAGARIHDEEEIDITDTRLNLAFRASAGQIERHDAGTAAKEESRNPYGEPVSPGTKEEETRNPASRQKIPRLEFPSH
jgi:hypothetical protein